MACWSFYKVWTPPRPTALMKYLLDCWRTSRQNSRQPSLRSSVNQCSQALYQSLGSRPGSPQSTRRVTRTILPTTGRYHWPASSARHWNTYSARISEAISTSTESSLQPTMASELNIRVRCNCWWPPMTFYDTGTLGNKWISPSLTSVRPLIPSPTECCLVSWNITVSVAHPWSGSRNS